MVKPHSSSQAVIFSSVGKLSQPSTHCENTMDTSFAQAFWQSPKKCTVLLYTSDFVYQNKKSISFIWIKYSNYFTKFWLILALLTKVTKVTNSRKTSGEFIFRKKNIIAKNRYKKNVRRIFIWPLYTRFSLSTLYTCTTTKTTRTTNQQNVTNISCIFTHCYFYICACVFIFKCMTK